MHCHRRKEKGWLKSKKKMSTGQSWFHVCVGWVGPRCHKFGDSLMKHGRAGRLWFQKSIHLNRGKKWEKECVFPKAVYMLWVVFGVNISSTAGEETKSGLTDDDSLIACANHTNNQMHFCKETRIVIALGPQKTSAAHDGWMCVPGEAVWAKKWSLVVLWRSVTKREHWLQNTIHFNGGEKTQYISIIKKKKEKKK